jgi:CIC family chloride channel protein
VFFKIYSKLKFFIDLAQERLSHKQFMLLSSILIGLSSGFAAIILKNTAHYIYVFAVTDEIITLNIWHLFLPIIGIFLTTLIIHKFLKNKFEKGLSQIHYSIRKRAGFIPFSRMYDQIITSSVTVGLGGSTGLEAPIVITGAALGSNYSRSYKLTKKDRMLLLACGVAAGISAAFNAPIAGVLFALEVLLLDINITAFTSLIIASASGSLLSIIIMNENVFLSFIITENFNYWNVIFYIVLGILCGLLAVTHARTFTKIEMVFQNNQMNMYSKALIGGLFLTILIAIFPPLFGEGYQSIRALVNQDMQSLFSNSLLNGYLSNEWFILLSIGLLLFFKSLATGLTIGSGGNGGNFAPSLFLGAYLGFLFSRIVNYFDFIKLPENNFTVVGMAGVLSGLYHAPLTAIFLIAEITGGYKLMIPLMIVSSISFLISKYLEPYAMEMKKMVESGISVFENKDHELLANLNIKEIILTDYPIFKLDMEMNHVKSMILNSKKNVFPVVDDQIKLIGVIWLDDLRSFLFTEKQENNLVIKDLMVKPNTKMDISVNAKELMYFFETSDNWVVPIVENGIYMGFVLKSDLLSRYRMALLQSNT